MSKRHTMGVSKWLPSTKDKITFEITLRPSTPDISKHLCICICICIYIQTFKFHHQHSAISMAETFILPHIIKCIQSFEMRHSCDIWVYNGILDIWVSVQTL